MRNVFFLLIVSAFCPSFVFSQTSDEVRSSSGLPFLIPGGRASQNPLLGIEVSGTLIIDGENPPTEQPDFVIYIVPHSNNSFVFGRQKLKNRSSFKVEAVPTGLASLVLEVNGTEFARYPLNMGSTATIRQDITLTWKQVGEGLAKASVIDARRYYKRSLDNQKLFEKAMAEKKENKTDSAVSTFKELLKNDTKDFVAWTELATIYFKNEEFLEAEKTYIKALQQNIEYMVALVNLGKLYLNQKQPEKAILVLNKAVEVEPSSADAQHFLGEAYLLAKKGSKAVGYLNEAIRLAPIQKAELHLRLASLYNAANLKDKAVNEYKLFLDKVPDYFEKKKLEQYIAENSPK